MTVVGSPIAVTDVRVLRAVHEHDGVVMTTAALAAALGVAEDEAAARITELTNDGLLSPPMQSRSRGGVWSEIGVKVTENGRGVLEAESRAGGSVRPTRLAVALTGSRRRSSTERRRGSQRTALSRLRWFDHE